MPKTRDEIFEELYLSHTKTWDRGPQTFVLNIPKDPYIQFCRWRMQWWHKMEQAFPDKILNGVATRHAHKNPRA